MCNSFVNSACYQNWAWTCTVGSGFKPIAMEQQLAGDGQVTVMQAVPAGAGGQQVQVMSLSKSVFLSKLY